jgi:hypothetical protein
MPDGASAWVSAGRYAGLRVTLSEFLPHLTTWDDPHAERPDAGFYRCAILMHDPAEGVVVDLVPRRFVTLSPPWSDDDAR